MMKPSFVLYTSYRQQIDLLTMEQRGVLLTAIMAYVSEDEMPEMDGMTQMAFSFIRADLDKNEEKYQKTIDARREAGKKGGRPKANGFSEKQKKQMVFRKSKEKQKNPVDEYVDVDVYVDAKASKGNRRFAPPTTEDVRKYIAEKGYDVDAERFVDFYASKNWMVGKNKMSDWKAAVRNWARSQRKESTANGPKNTNRFNNFSPSGTDWDSAWDQVMEADEH